MKHYFGTDGIRGKVGNRPITADCMLKLGWAIGATLGHHSRNKILIGKDTRRSGYLIESALEAGLVAAGASVYLTGPMPTPAIAYLTRAFRAKIGLVISASHNDYTDNGVKFFSSDGLKISPDFELQIDEWISRPMHTVDSAQLGKAYRVPDAAGRYIEFCKSAIPHGTDFQNLKVVLDCANGATYHIAPFVLRELGAQVIATNVAPDGVNINVACGSTHTEQLQQRVRESGADLGISLDGDGDRLILIDEQGAIVDGDDILFILSTDLLRAKRLQGGVVGTVISNGGLAEAMHAHGIPFLRTAVGDQHVIQALLEKGWYLGGEPCGHLINLQTNTTGDGLIAALNVIKAMLDRGKTLRQLKAGWHKLPQVHINLPGLSQFDLTSAKAQNALQQIEKELAHGRMIVRPSQTEDCLRITVEATTLEQAERTATDIQYFILSEAKT